MTATPFVNRCILDTLGGLRDGLSLFSGQSRAAVIFSLVERDELSICDPQNLLRGYEPKLKNIFSDNINWTPSNDRTQAHNSYNFIEPLENLQLDGLISRGGCSAPVYYQMWFTEHHPNLCSIGPTECWLEHAVLRFSHDIANESHLYTGISGSFLREYSSHAVRDHIVKKACQSLGSERHIRIYPVLDSILGISKTNEEGVLPFGKLTFIEPHLLNEVKFLVKFKSSQRPLLNNYKHVRKLLQSAEHPDHTLVSDGTSILGICDYNISQFHITADFQGRIGFLKSNSDLICSFQDGRYSSNTNKAKLFEVEEALLDFELETSRRNDLFRIIADLVHNAEDKSFGCSFVIDLASSTTDTSGQLLTPPLDLRDPNKLKLAGALAKVDGALHIRSDLQLYSFACLLDGHKVQNENRARGARYNSALRFTAQHPRTIVVVVSADRPVSIFQQGKEIQNRYSNSDSLQCILSPLSLAEWLKTL